MCYSAKVKQNLRDLERQFGARPDYAQILDLFERRHGDPSIKISRAFEANFDAPRNAEEQRLKDLTAEHRTILAAKWERELFAQKKRLADAERKLKDKETKIARNDERVATKKVEQLANWLEDLKRSDIRPQDSRIYPMHYAPIVIRESGERRVVLARYHCRGADKPASIDRKFPGLYNARRNNLEKFWRAEFSHTHAICVIDAFYENVDRDGKNVVLQFEPNPPKQMIVGCLYAQSPDLLSFAAITDEPPAEVSAAGHDRCVVNLKAENVAAWLAPESQTIEQLQAVLSDVEKPIYAHRVSEAA